MADNIKIDNFSSAIADEMAKYSEEVSKTVIQIIKEEAQLLTDNIKKDSPKRSKKVARRTLNRYSKGWTATTEIENNLFVEINVHNKSDYQLTHLLENGHANRDGSRTEGKEHIKPNEEITNERIEKRIKEAVENL